MNRQDRSAHLKTVSNRDRREPFVMNQVGLCLTNQRFMLISRHSMHCWRFVGFMAGSGVRHHWNGLHPFLPNCGTGAVISCWAEISIRYFSNLLSPPPSKLYKGFCKCESRVQVANSPRSGELGAWTSFPYNAHLQKPFLLSGFCKIFLPFYSVGFGEPSPAERRKGR